MEQDWEWAAAAPAPPAPAAQQSGGVRQELPEDLFCSPAENSAVGLQSGPLAVGSSPPAAHQHQHASQKAAPPPGELHKGAAVFYRDRSAWVEAKIVSVDQTISPPSYCVELAGGAMRETEQHRLRPRPPAAAEAAEAAAAAGARSVANGLTHSTPALAPAQGAAAPVAAMDDADDFGDFAAAVPAPTVAPGVHAAAAPSPPAAAAAAAAAEAAAAVEDDEDGFGDFAAAPMPEPPRPAQAAVQPQRTGSASRTPHGSPERLPSRRSSAAASPIDRFRSFLHSVVPPEMVQQLELEEAAEDERWEQAQQAQQQPQQPQQQAPVLPPEALFGGGFPAGGPFAAAAAAAPSGLGAAAAAPVAATATAAAAADDWGEGDFGDFEGAAAGPEPDAPPPAAQQPEHQPVPPVPAGVRRDAPLPLELFAEEEEVLAEGPAAEEGGSVTAAAAAPAPVPEAPAALPPEGQHEHPHTPPASRLPSTFTDPAGRLVMVDYADAFVRVQPQQQQSEHPAGEQPREQPGLAAPPPAEDEWGDDFADFVGPPSPAAEPAAAATPAAAAAPAAELETVAAPAAVAVAAAELAAAVAPAAAAVAAEADAVLVPHETEQPAAAAAAAAPQERAPASPSPAAHEAAEEEAGWGDDDFADFSAAPAEPALAEQQQQQQQAWQQQAWLDDAAASAQVEDAAAAAAGAGQEELEQRGEAAPTAKAAPLPAAGRSSLGLEDTAAALDGQSWGAASAANSADECAVPEQPPAEEAGQALAAASHAAAATALGTAAAALQLQPGSPGSTASGGSSRQSALLSALHPISSRGGSARSSFEYPVPPALHQQQWQGAATLSSAQPGAGASGLATSEEVVTEYAVAWGRLLQAAAAQLQASAALWSDAGSQGCWRDLQALPAAQQHLQACGQLYCAAGVVRLAAQQLGLLSLVSELQEGWAGVEAAWTSPPPVEALQDGSDEGEAATPAADATAADAAAAGEEEEEDGTAAAEAQPQPSFRDAVLAACGAAAGGGGAAGGAAEPLPLLGVLEGAAARLDAMSLDDFPRLLAWSEGLCGISLLPLSLFEGVVPAAPWAEGRPCLVPLANLWLHRVSQRPPQLD